MMTGRLFCAGKRDLLRSTSCRAFVQNTVGDASSAIKRKAAPRSYDADALLKAWPALEEAHPELLSRRVDSRALQALVKKGTVPEAVAEAALCLGKAPAPQIAIETAPAKDGGP